MIRPATDQDAQALADIYNHYIEHSTATFEEEPVTASNMIERINKVNNANLPWLVITVDSKIIGYAYAAPWKERSAYRYSVEATVYLDPKAQGKGLGTELYQALFAELKQKSIHSVIAGITLPNPASIALHEKLGMVQVAHFHQIGRKFDQWLDTGYWQLIPIALTK